MADLEAKTIMPIGVKLFLYRPMTKKAMDVMRIYEELRGGFYAFSIPPDWSRIGLTVEELPDG